MSGLTLTDAEVLKCPFAAYKTLRDEHPVYRDPVSGIYIVSRYDDIRKVASRPELFSNHTRQLLALQNEDRPAQIMKERGCPHIDTMVTADPPVHGKYRSLVEGAFRITRIQQLDGYIEQIARELIGTFENAGSAEILSELAIPMPMYIIADQLGVPRKRHVEFKQWSDALLLVADPGFPEEQRAQAAERVVAMQAFLRQQVDAYRRVPADNIFSDVANATIDGRPITPEEVINVVTQLLVAGNETTTGTMAMGLQLMIREGLEEKLRADPTRIPVFVEEVLRLTTALQGLFRRATTDTEIGGVPVPKDAIVMLRWAAGNRDERRFEHADHVDLERQHPQGHLAFGYGIHYCPGNALARSELRIAFRVLLERVRNLRIADEPDAEQWLVHAFARGMTRLKLRFDHA